MMSDDILLAESTRDDSRVPGATKNKLVLQRRMYSPPTIIPLESYSINSGSAYAQPETTGGVWWTHS